MIAHMGFPVSDYERAKAFYAKALAPLGYILIMEVTQEQTGHDPAAGFGADGKPDFWIGGEGGVNKPVHVAIVAKDRTAVDAFYEAALAAGGRDNGAPGIRAHYHPNYYGAFVLDADGHNIEAVFPPPAEASPSSCAGLSRAPRLGSVLSLSRRTRTVTMRDPSRSSSGCCSASSTCCGSDRHALCWSWRRPGGAWQSPPLQQERCSSAVRRQVRSWFWSCVRSLDVKARDQGSWKPWYR